MPIRAGARKARIQIQTETLPNWANLPISRKRTQNRSCARFGRNQERGAGRPGDTPMKSAGKSVYRKLPSFGILTLGGLLCCIVLFVVRSMEERTTRSIFESVADVSFENLEANIRQTLDNVDAMGAFYDASHHVERQEFAEFAARLLVHDKAIQALEWAPRVGQPQRADYERNARREGLAAFQFTERGERRQMVRARERSQYFPVLYVEPSGGNEATLGFDLATDAVRYTALLGAAESGELMATEPVVLLQEKNDQYGFLLFRPSL